ncbi:hypothetical protein ACFFGH_22730 [Lysobacter korlensis]|uniref:TPM domain-containing protein n=1 Tax=Lysobacter korlensis TaxID=553636 RepID=A0ABV6RV52_9GAMM
MDLALLLVGIAAVAVLAIVVGAAVRRSRARAARERLAQEQQAAAQLSELERAAGVALVRADERIRLADDEVGFAVAEFGETAVADFRAALQRARQRLSEAFHLNQLLSDHVPDTEAQRREWNERIVSLCQSAEAAIAEQASAFAARRDTVRRTPSQIQRVRADVERTRQAIPAARRALTALAERYADASLSPVAANADQAEQLLRFAERSTEVAESRLAASRDSEADAAVRAAEEAARRADALLDAVDSFEVEALQAESTLAAMVAESHAELSAARALPESERRGRIDGAIASLERALAALPAPGARLDPIGSLSALRQANTALDEAVAERTQRAHEQDRLRAQLLTAMDDAERQIASARSMITDYRVPIGPDARTRLAEAELQFAGIPEERDPALALARARRAAALAADAAAFAHADLQRLQGYGSGGYGGYGPQGYGPRGGISIGGGQILGGVLGGLAIGGLLDGLGDLGDFGDFGDFG